MSIKHEILNGVFWTAIQKYSGLVIQLIITAVLARLISPSDFGIIAIATVLILFFNLFTEMGIGPAIVQRKDLSVHDLSIIYSTTVYGGILLSILFFFLSYPISFFYNNATLILICQILSINLLFSALNIVPNALIVKNKRFRFIASRTLFLQLSSGIFAVVAVFNSLGIFSLLIPPIFTAIGVFILNFHQYPQKFQFKLEKEPLAKIFSFSLYQFLFNFLNYFSRNSDNLIIGKYIGLPALGYYEKSYKLMMLPLQTITSVITPVMHPVLSCLQDNLTELSNKYNQIVKILATISFPLGALLHFTAFEIIRIVYGQNWDNAIPVFSILALSLPFQMVLSSIGAIYQSSGKTNWMFCSGLLNTISTVSGFVISAVFFKTLESFAWSWNITLTLNIITSYIILHQKVLYTSIINMLRTLIIPALNFILVYIFLFLIQKFFIEINIFVALLSKSLIALLITYLCIQQGKQYDLNKIVLDQLSRIFKKQNIER